MISAFGNSHTDNEVPFVPDLDVNSDEFKHALKHVGEEWQKIGKWLKDSQDNVRELFNMLQRHDE